MLLTAASKSRLSSQNLGFNAYILLSISGSISIRLANDALLTWVLSELFQALISFRVD